jgi:hypothetical protein
VQGISMSMDVANEIEHGGRSLVASDEGLAGDTYLPLVSSIFRYLRFALHAGVRLSQASLRFILETPVSGNMSSTRVKALLTSFGAAPLLRKYE